MKKILGLDLGTNSIGWALVNEAENENEKSSIIKLGVRVNPLTVDEQQNFEKGKSITTNADRTLKRSMRRNLQRYKLRRENLIEILKEHNFICDDTILSENGNFTTFETYKLRAKAATEEVSLEQFARILLMINKKRGYKSSRKAKGTEDGVLIDGMEVAKMLYNENLTPGQYSYQQLDKGKKHLPDFYRSDLQREFNKIFEKQQTFYSEILTEELKKELEGKKRDAVWAICAKAFKEKDIELVGIKRQGTTIEQKIENFLWRTKGLSEKLSLEQIVVVLQQINIQINSSSGYLGAISDRSKELFFNKIKKSDGSFRGQTVGEYQMEVLNKNPNASLRNMVFYRQDYLDEFNTIWEKQAEFHTELTEKLKQEIRDVVIFYQRPLKSQKGLISFCEFESRKIEVEVDGKKKIKTVGSRVIPRSSPLFQEFKIWQVLNNVEVFAKGIKRNKQKEAILFDQNEDPLQFGGRRELYQEEKELLAAELTIRKELKKAEILKLLFDNTKNLDLNFNSIQGNLTQSLLFDTYERIVQLTGHDINTNKKFASEIIKLYEEFFVAIGYNADILKFSSDISLESQAMFRLWHLLYSFEGDDSKTGNEKLVKKISELCGFESEYASILANITFQDDYGSLSSKAISKILPYLKAGHKFDVACEYAGYRHSASSLTKEELENKTYKDRLIILPKNSLRNPVVEKILNQMINVVNTIIDNYGKPDEIRIELARELKKNAKEREELTKSIAETTRLHEQYKEILSKPPYSLSYISRNDIIRYKLYEELKDNSYKTLYSNEYISPSSLFNGDFDVEHIIPQSRLFDDSFSNKTLELRRINIEKGNKTAYDFIKEKYGETGDENSLDNYLNRIDNLHKMGVLSRAKYNKLKIQEKDIPDGFIDRDIRDTQYIAKYAKTMLSDLVKFVVSTSGSITDRLREDWQLVDVMKELNWEKYKSLGLTEDFMNEEGNRIRKIKDWSKRNDHRHHAMDALTIAFTKRAFIQYLNNLNARSDKSSSIYGIEQNELYRNGKGKMLFKPPMPLDEFRTEAKRHLENTLISIKAKNKVVTQNINTTKKSGGTNRKVQLTPRGQLHNETIYGSQKKYIVKEETVNAKFDLAKIATVTKLRYKKALLQRLNEFGNDPKKAFTGTNALSKNPIWLNELHTEKVPEKVKTLSIETVYTIRKDISPDLKIDKVIDKRVKEVLEARLKEFNGNAKQAFSNLDENPIWLNKEKSISIKRVTITGVSNAEPLHDKRDKEGNIILSNDGKKQAVDFVSTSNNHHVAIYRDADGNLQDYVVSFYEAVCRRNLGLPIIDKEFKVKEGWTFLFSMKQNEYFVFPNEKTGFNPLEVDLLNSDNYALISPNLFRVQTMSKVIYGNNIIRDYKFRHHLETSVKDIIELKNITYKQYKTLNFINNIYKVRINHIGQIVSVGEY
ncbi:MAG: type II CRISPR RNA-guided endonuclease Cas9 [Bacteroidales bacterium]|nr:type II CRISPR RNA-guided endonuclease Cas9 [Bacteroidales bacterium]